MSFSATDCPLDDTCMDIHMSEKTPTSLGHQLRGMEREANAKVVSLAVVVMVEVVVIEMAKVVVMVVVGSGCGGRDGEYSGRGGGDSEGSGMGEKGVAGTTCCDSGCG